MTTKKKTQKVVNELADDASFEDALEKLFVLANIERGITQADQEQTLSHQEMTVSLSRRHPFIV